MFTFPCIKGSNIVEESHNGHVFTCVFCFGVSVTLCDHYRENWVIF
jgi:hypothetical protein